MIFLDFEASALALKNGFPIEIGWAIVHPDRHVTTEAHLIRCDRWLEQVERWDPKAEILHKISRQLLIDSGETPVDVATRANEILANETVYIDSKLDDLWALMLFSEAGVGRRFKFEDVDAAFSGREIDRRSHEFARGFAEREYPQVHRAAPDAAHWAHLYRMSLKEEARPLQRSKP